MTYAIQKQMWARGAFFPKSCIWFLHDRSLVLYSWYRKPMQLLCKLKLKINSPALTQVSFFKVFSRREKTVWHANMFFTHLIWFIEVCTCLHNGHMRKGKEKFMYIYTKCMIIHFIEFLLHEYYDNMAF